jgi:precorrin-3B synthase
MSSVFVRGACPSLSEPMQTGDGLLARMVIAGSIRLDRFAALCAAAREHGNGVIEVSARGSLQIRGLTSQSAPLFTAAVASLDVPICDGVPVIASPLRGDHAALIDADALAADLRRAIADAAPRLAPKVSVVADGGGALHLDALAADIRLRAVGADSAQRLHVSLAGDASSATPIGSVVPANAVEVATALLAAIAAIGPEARAADLLHAKGASAVRAELRVHVEPAASLPKRPEAEPIALHPLEDGAHALGLGLGFGHAQADALIELANMAKANGAQWVRPAPQRTLLLGALAELHAVTVKRAAGRLGFITDASDPRRRIIACPGAPSCASGLIAARAIAAELAGRLPPALPLVHIAGCAKGCAHPGPAPLTIVGTSQGCGIVHDGTARDTPESYVAPHDLAATLVRLPDLSEAAHA